MLTPDLLLLGYSRGLFPMAEARDSAEVHWYDPLRRGILPLDGFHVPHRLRRTVRADPFVVEADRDFEGVIRACAEAGQSRQSTWINEEIVRVYSELHRLGHAHSVECRRDGKLAGGLYGVRLGGAFFGESMFSRETDASKVALVHLVARLRLGAFQLLDTQFVTAHLARFGAAEITRAQYQRRLRAALAAPADFYRAPGRLSGAAALQSITQTS